jgi:hypothetical protein
MPETVLRITVPVPMIMPITVTTTPATTITTAQPTTLVMTVVQPEITPALPMLKMRSCRSVSSLFQFLSVQVLTCYTALDAKVIGKSFADDGNNPPEEGQSASLTSTNNFINFCLTTNLPITDGQQIESGSCNPVPIGAIPAKAKMPASKFQNPKNLDKVPANQAFTIVMAINNLQTGTFVNAKTKYFAAPQQLNADGTIIGHSVSFYLPTVNG